MLIVLSRAFLHELHACGSLLFNLCSWHFFRLDLELLQIVARRSMIAKTLSPAWLAGIGDRRVSIQSGFEVIG